MVKRDSSHDLTRPNVGGSMHLLRWSVTHQETTEEEHITIQPQDYNRAWQLWTSRASDFVLPGKVWLFFFLPGLYVFPGRATNCILDACL